MRYKLEQIILSKSHPAYPHRLVWTIWDNQFNRAGLAYYLTIDTAQKYLDKLDPTLIDEKVLNILSGKKHP